MVALHGSAVWPASATVVAVVACLAATGLRPVSGSPFSSSSVRCSEDCVQFLLTDSLGPKVLRLYKEILKPDIGSTVPVDVNGQTYKVSSVKKHLIENAVRKGIPDSIIEGMLDDAAILPSGPAADLAHLRPGQQQSIERPTRLEPVRERRPPLSSPTVGSGASPKVYTKSNGDINVLVNGQSLKLPDDVARLPLIVDSRDDLQDIVRQLKELGVPLKLDGTRLSIDDSPATLPESVTLRVSITRVDDRPTGLTVRVNNDEYHLPGAADEQRLSRYLAREPEIAYHLLRILSKHRVPVDYDSATKTLTTRLANQEPDAAPGGVSERHSYAPTTHSAGSGGSRLPSAGESGGSGSGGLTTPTATSPKIVRISGTSYYLPDDWDRLRRDLRDGRVSASTVLDTLDDQRVAAPRDVIEAIRARITNAVSKVRVMRYGDDVSIELGSHTYKLPGDARDLEKALRENEFPIELIRDSLLRIGIDSRRVGSSLRVLLPGGEAYLSGLPTTRQYDYKVASDLSGVKITAGSDTYTLPADKLLVEQAISEKKLLPRTLVDAFNGVGIASEMDINKQEMTVDLPSGKIRIPVPLNIQHAKSGKRIALKVRGSEGNRVYIFTVGEDQENDKVELPSQLSTLNSYIRSGKVDVNLIMQLLGRMGVPHYLDSFKDAHIVTLNGEKYEIANAPGSDRYSGGHRQIRL